MKCQTALLIPLSIKLCLFYTVISDSINFLLLGDYPTILGTDDIFIFDLLTCIVFGLSLIFSSFIVLFAILGHRSSRKPYLYFTFSFYLLVCLPFFVSGLYFFYIALGRTVIDNDVKLSFEKIINRTNNSSDPSIDNYILEIVQTTQDRFCCCGFKSWEDYKFDHNNFNQSGYLNITIKGNNEILTCPNRNHSKNCQLLTFPGCYEAVQGVYPKRILIYSVIGLLFTIITLITIPFWYGEFERQRRAKRAQYIRDWRKEVGTFVSMQKKMTQPSKMEVPKAKNSEKAPLIPLKREKSSKTKVLGKTQKSKRGEENKAVENG